jgi:hypothetical protein
VSLYARIAAGLLIALAVAGLWWKADRMLDAADERGYQRAKQEDQAAADAQTASNRELQRLAEQHFHALAGAQDRFLTKATKEIHDAAAPLAACPVPESVRVRFNAARECALGDSPAACGAGDPVPGAR